MGRQGSGVEVREKSIRLSFTLDGKQHRYTLKIAGAPAAPTPANVKYAHRLAEQIRTAIARGTFELATFFPDEAPPTPHAPTLTLAGHLNAWQTTLRGAANTRIAYAAAARWWSEAQCTPTGGKLGDRPLAELSASDINAALALRPELKPSTINGYRRRLHIALQAAVDDGLIAANPVAKVKTAKTIKRPPDPFTREELEAILADLRARTPEQVWNVFEFWAHTGLRTGELIALRWSRVDLASGQIEISEARSRSELNAHTKTGKDRVVLLNSRARAALERQRKHSQMAGSLVWTRPDGKPWPGDWDLTKTWWVPCLRRLGMRYRRPYTLRHTHATIMLMAGCNPAFAAGQLGHSVELFLDTYSRWIGGDADAREMARIEAALGSISPGSSLGGASS